ncbi:MAG: 3-deoxy-7-phosphoheptulonate synthase class II [Myxococcota bacterium]|nr:3-deoxy-7-phosphoheptulonate synthase class II [Myxococcota bacterium]
MTWTPQSWRGLPIRQQPEYDDPEAVKAALDHLRALPPLVHSGEVDALREQLARAGRGECFVLQGGDCAERFVDLNAQAIENKLKILLQMSVVLTWGARIPVVRIGRMAGQFAKPRSRPTEIVDGVEIPTYRGDHINGHDPSERTPDPQRLVQAYFHASTTLNYVRALLDGGFADLRQPEHWDLGFVQAQDKRAAYEDILARIGEAVDFMGAVGADAQSTLSGVQFFTSHEGLLLPYEEAMTVQTPKGHYNLGAHFLWIGDRTRQLDHAHIEYFRGIQNPIGVKCGPSMQPDELVQVVRALNPDDIPGRITLITRYGAGRVAELLPGHIRAIQDAGLTVTWSCDPMHGNTRSTEQGLKTRDVANILGELKAVMDTHQACGSVLGGVHFEMTGEDVTECVGGPQGLADHHLSHAYETFCDPRLNYAQALEIAFLIAQRLRQER